MSGQERTAHPVSRPAGSPLPPIRPIPRPAQRPAVAEPFKRLPGRPPSCPEEVLSRVVALRERGATYAGICDELNRDGVPTPGGGRRWYPSHVSRLLHTRNAQRLLRT
ncbi:recombinase family protein [Nonomuraea typhae]|uniref:Recombinase family protein n=1 Tax=Nonomuraea typhae TaxID=2603600 RepID=A0ABW7YKD3_9ACTN